MGVEHYAVCHDCKLFAGLDKYYDWAPHLEKEETPNQMILRELGEIPIPMDAWVFRALILHGFINVHPGHRIEVVNEYKMECNYMGICDCESYSQQVHDPVKLCSYEPDSIFGNCWRD